MSGSSREHIPSVRDLIPLATASSIPKADYDRNRVIYGFVDRVIDGTKFRVRHLPGYRVWKRKPIPLDDNKDVDDKTIGVKLYAIQLPSLQTGKNNKDGDDNNSDGPGAKEFAKGAKKAKKYLESMILHQMVRLKLFYRNKQNYAVCQVEISRDKICFCIGGKKEKIDMSQKMAEIGYAELLTNATKDTYSENIMEVIKEAKKKRLGLWIVNEVLYSPLEIKKAQKRQKSLKKIISANGLMREIAYEYGEQSSPRRLSGEHATSRRFSADNLRQNSGGSRRRLSGSHDTARRTKSGDAMKNGGRNRQDAPRRTKSGDAMKSEGRSRRLSGSQKSPRRSNSKDSMESGRQGSHHSIRRSNSRDSMESGSSGGRRKRRGRKKTDGGGNNSDDGEDEVLPSKPRRRASRDI